MDMEAGIEHLGRSTAMSMDSLLIIIEPTLTSIETAQRIRKLAGDLKMKTFFIGNKIRGKDDENFLNSNLERESVLGFVSYNEGLRGIDKGGSIMDIDMDSSLLSHIKNIKQKLLKVEKLDEQKKITR